MANGRASLQVGLSSGGGLVLRSVQFGNPGSNPSAPANALIDALGQIGIQGAFMADLPTRPSQISILVRRQFTSGATTVPMIVTDGCGAWPTFVGGG